MPPDPTLAGGPTPAMREKEETAARQKEKKRLTDVGNGLNDVERRILKLASILENMSQVGDRAPVFRMGPMSCGSIDFPVPEDIAREAWESQRVVCESELKVLLEESEKFLAVIEKLRRVNPPPVMRWAIAILIPTPDVEAGLLRMGWTGGKDVEPEAGDEGPHYPTYFTSDRRLASATAAYLGIVWNPEGAAAWPPQDGDPAMQVGTVPAPVEKARLVGSQRWEFVRLAPDQHGPKGRQMVVGKSPDGAEKVFGYNEWLKLPVA